MASEASARHRRWIIRGIAATVLLGCFALIGLAAFPFGLFKDAIAGRIGSALGTQVSIGSIERREWLSFTPTIVLRDIAVKQPAWAGKGDMVHARTIEARLPILPLLVGRGPQPEGFVAHGLTVALVRDAKGRANWQGQDKADDARDDAGTGLERLTIPDGRITVRDDKRSLNLAGSFVSDARGLRVDAAGKFHEAPARMTLRGGRIADLPPEAPYPLRLELRSPLLNLAASGQSRGALNLKAMTLDIHATAPNLKYLEDVIEAGLFGTRAIDLKARVRHTGRDWHIERMTGSIGRSKLVAKADVLKREGRTKIDADIHFSAFDFDDLSDAEGKARAATIEARIGPRVLPGTRINLAKVGPTDGVIRFRADRLLLEGSAFRSLSGVIRLDGKLLTLDDVVAGMSSGRMSGKVSIDQRGGAAYPILALDLAFQDGRLETLMGSRDATGPLRGRVVLKGAGDTIREALARADGRAGLLVRGGTVKRTFAAVLGQDLGKAIGAVLRDKEAEVPLRCLAIGFAARDGVLTPSPFLVETGISVGQGQGRLSLAYERIALSIKGRSRDPSPLRLADPIQVGGTFSAPSLSAAGKPPGSKVGAGSVLSALGKSVGRALGLGKDRAPADAAIPAALDCDRLGRQIL